MPSSNDIKPLLLHTKKTSIYIANFYGDTETDHHTDDNFRALLMPDSWMVSHFYTAVAQGFTEYQKLTVHVLATVPILFTIRGGTVNFIRGIMSCDNVHGGKNHTLISVACGTCVPFVDMSNMFSLSLENTSININDYSHLPWCGTVGGYYKVRTDRLQPGERVHYVKRLSTWKDRGGGDTIQGQVMSEVSCAWRQYYCLTDPITYNRDDNMPEIVLVRPAQSEINATEGNAYIQEFMYYNAFVPPIFKIPYRTGSYEAAIATKYYSIMSPYMVPPGESKLYHEEYTGIGTFVNFDRRPHFNEIDTVQMRSQIERRVKTALSGREYDHGIFNVGQVNDDMCQGT